MIQYSDSYEESFEAHYTRCKFFDCGDYPGSHLHSEDTQLHPHPHNLIY